jgi:hypothetical protein
MKTTTWMAAAIAAATLSLVAPATHVAAATASAAAGKAATQKSFATPQEAAKALVDAVRAGNANDLLALIGQGSKSWLFSGDKVSDRAEWKRFLDAYDRKNSIRTEGDSKAVLEAGDGDWSFPAPLVKRGDRWVFDVEAGREEVLNRRVGRNELDTVQTLLAIVDAQREYAASDPDHNGINDYAQKFRSVAGQEGRPVLADEGRRAAEPARAARRAGGAGGLRRRREIVRARGVPRLPLPPADCARQGGPGRRLQLRRQRQAVRRLRRRRLAGVVRQLGSQVVPRQPRGHRLREGPRAEVGRRRPRR